MSLLNDPILEKNLIREKKDKVYSKFSSIDGLECLDSVSIHDYFESSPLKYYSRGTFKTTLKFFNELKKNSNKDELKKILSNSRLVSSACIYLNELNSLNIHEKEISNLKDYQQINFISKYLKSSSFS